MTVKLFCACGNRRSKWLPECTPCATRKHEEHYAAAEAIVRTGKCPDCGAGLKRNSSLHGWWQCEQFGAEQFRKDATKPACSFQTFTR